VVSNIFQFHRYLADNYWNCPISNYSSSQNDYNLAKSRCGKINNASPYILKLFIIYLCILDSSCDPNPCSPTQTCSTRLSGTYSCCPPGYNGNNCQGSLIFCSSKQKKKERKRKKERNLRNETNIH